MRALARPPDHVFSLAARARADAGAAQRAPAGGPSQGRAPDVAARAAPATRRVASTPSAAMKTSLQVRLSQHLALTPQLQQSIRLLQLSTIELNQEIEQALVENPLLERDDDPLATALRVASDGAIIASTPASAASERNDESAEERGDPRADERAAGPDGAADGGAAEDSPLDWGGGGRSERDEDDDGGLAWAASAPSLAQHLLEQLHATRATARDRALVELLIEALDDRGYLSSSLEELQQLCPPEADIELDDLSAALALLHSFDPPGVGARDAAECLRLQLDALLHRCATQERPAMQMARRIVSEHLPLLAARDFARLRKLLDATDEQLRDAQQVIRGLNPHPGVGFGEAVADYIVPDIFVRKRSARWLAQLNPDVMPKLRVNQAYAAAVKAARGSKDREGQASWSTRLQEARWLIRNIQQRFDTILRVSQAIVDRQQNFFTHGAIAMRPLVLREIADTVGLHESTISRVTSNKYMATPFGVVELKYFFGSHVATDAGGAASSTAIRALIKQMIGVEDPRNPLSDSRLAELLGEQGIVVARRTVAKYRESLKIAPVAMRKVL
jgi:RNA polymerase sigma-54 factor